MWSSLRVASSHLPLPRRNGGLRHLERGHQPGTRQARCVRRSSAGTASGRTPGDRPTSSPRSHSLRRSSANADLWASCIGGAAEHETDLQASERSRRLHDATRSGSTHYAFLSDQARNASAKSASRASPSSPPSQRTEPTARTARPDCGTSQSVQAHCETGSAHLPGMTVPFTHVAGQNPTSDFDGGLRDSAVLDLPRVERLGDAGLELLGPFCAIGLFWVISAQWSTQHRCRAGAHHRRGRCARRS